MNNINTLLSNFKQPTAEYRSIPFWAWNDELNIDELLRQVKSMHQNGMGGFFMHSREGLESEYLGRHWMQCIKEVSEYARTLGMEAWLYDEDKWPSGSAGGKTAKLFGDTCRAKAVTVEILNSLTSIPGNAVLIKVITNNNNGITCTDFVSNQVLDDNQSVAVFRIETAPRCEWFNNSSAPDNLNAESVKHFIELTHEKYKSEVENLFSNVIPGIFTDEPNIADSNNTFNGRSWIPWTTGFDLFFTKQRGYSILSKLYKIFFDVENCQKIRHDYWRTIGELFSKSYVQQISDWCKNNNLKSTGHFLFEGDWGWGTRSGGSIMPNYQYLSVPAIDMLCNQRFEVLTVKQCSSVANQFNKPTVLSEMYAATGWEFTFEDQKWIGDWQFVLGVTRRAQHLGLSSLRGCRKRDYPPCFSYQNSWFDHNSIVEDYFARLSAILTGGSAYRDLLVLHPQSTAWMMLGCSHDGSDIFTDPKVSSVNNYSYDFNETLKHLLAIHYDFDLGDETIMKENSSVNNGTLTIGKAKYKVVLITHCKTLLKETVLLLESFLNSGGKIIAIYPFPDMIEGENNELINKLVNHSNFCKIQSPSNLETALSSAMTRDIDIRDRYNNPISDIWYLHKHSDNIQSLFISNTNRNCYYEAYICINTSGNITELEPLTGTIKTIPADNKDGFINISTTFAPCESRLYIIESNKKMEYKNIKMPVPTMNIFSVKPVISVLNKINNYKLSNPNVLPLDRCSFTLNNEKYEETELWRAQYTIREKLKMHQIYYNGILQRYNWIKEPHVNDGTSFSLEFIFYITDEPNFSAYLAIEPFEDLKIILNNNISSIISSGWYIDRAYSKYPLRELRKGENKLCLSGKYFNRTELEDCFIIGNFGVNNDNCITSLPKKLQYGNWCIQGFPYYSGSITYCYNFNIDQLPQQKIYIDIGEYSATVISVFINEQKCFDIPWKSSQKTDISGFIKKGNNLIEIEVVSSLRNTLGPLHLTSQRMHMTLWCSFRSEGLLYSKEACLQPYGLYSPVIIDYDNTLEAFK